MQKTGILLPIFSLNNKYGIGCLGKEVYEFIDFLSIARQDFWQILPTNPTSYGDSPYQSFSIYAQNPYFVDLEQLVNDKLISKKKLKEAKLFNVSNHIDYGNLFTNKIKLLKEAYKKVFIFKDEFETFKKDNEYWLVDYALFMTLKEINDYRPWNLWDDEYKSHDKKALNQLLIERNETVEEFMFMQFLYHQQWQKVLQYAHSKNVQIIGDMPIYVAYDSVDVWANKEYFKLDENYNPTVVAGVPPDYFSKTGQLWGNPIYNYNKMKKNHYEWWLKRIRYNFSLFDYVRIDHFRGFSAYYEIPANSENAINGLWQKGPGYNLFKEINEKLSNPKIIAENLGLLDNDVHRLIKKCNYPGMRILQFEMYSNDNLKKLKKINNNNIIYPGTHDNNTFYSWFLNEASNVEKENVIKQLKLKPKSRFSYQLLKYTYSFKQKYVIISMQDILGLDENARINHPGTNSNNWTFKFNSKFYNKALANRLANLKARYQK